MDPRLITIAGPLKGNIFSLSDEGATIGREAANRICLSDMAVSRRHCVIELREDAFQVRDLDSFNGTFVNGVPVKDRRLDHGDRIVIGDSQFLFFLHGEDGISSFNTVQLEEERAPAHETVRLRQEDNLFRQPEKVLAALPQSVRLARDLNALLKISASVGSIRTLEALARELFDLISAVVPAETGAILLSDEHGVSEEFPTVFGWDRAEGADRPVRASRTIVGRVLSEGISILSNDAQGGEAFSEAESLAAFRISSVLAVPLAARERTLGVLYLSTSDPLSAFDEGHLQLAAAIAGIAAVAIENVRHVEWLEGENRRLVDEINISHNMVGESPRLREVYAFISKVAPTDSTVLIRGESGTGKELAARAIHNNSLRAGKPFVAINCAALTETLLESELFGHERGAFTGAVAQKKGKLEIADGGTVFLDELGEMTPLLQAKLLRVLQEREFERVGGTRPIRTNIRLIAATNRDLEAMIRQGEFRQDLYYRLNVISLQLPPLRERREDIPLLASYFAARAAERCHRTVRGLTREARACLLDYDWPGNIRELENAVEHAVVLGGEWIRPEDLPEVVLDSARDEVSSDDGGGSTKYHEAVKEMKKRLIREAISQAAGNLTESARLLGVHPNYLHRLIRNLNLRDELKK
ncbi:MAG: sigma 54-interacting transcriptional regulator [Acidobacteria bacterium]|nr:sigma 54-interacting transcriptional regulator [Acidobacteriota bacterium]